MANKLARLVKQLNTENWLERVIDECSSFHSPERWSSVNLEIHPSSAGSSCPRNIQLGFLGHRTEMKSKNFRRASNGTYAHERWFRDLEEAKVLVTHSKRHKVDGYWSGELDVIVENPVTGTRHIGEIKTMNSYKFAKIPPQDPDYTAMASKMMLFEPGYTKQLIHYIVMSEHFDSRLTDEAFFLIENTDTQDFVVRWIKPTQHMREDAFKHVNLAREASLKGELLDPPFKRKSPTCRKCYRELLCYKLQDGDEEAAEKVNEALAIAKDRDKLTEILTTNNSDEFILEID